MTLWRLLTRGILCSDLVDAATVLVLIGEYLERVRGKVP